MRARAATFDATDYAAPPKAPSRRPQLAPLEEPPTLELPARVPLAKLEEVWAKRSALAAAQDPEAVLSSSAPGDFAPRIWDEEPPVEDFMLDGFEDDGDDGCVFEMDDEGLEEDPGKFQLEPAAMAEDPEESSKVRTASTASTADSQLDGFTGSPVLKCCLVDIHREKRRVSAAGAGGASL